MSKCLIFDLLSLIIQLYSEIEVLIFVSKGTLT